MPYHRSLYGLTPVGPTVNYYDFLVGRPDLQSWPDYTLFVDAMTGKRRRFRETLARIEECATALSSEGRDGGLEIEPGSKEVVGILSENCMEYPILALALLKISVPVALIPVHLPADETLALLKRANVKTLFTSPKQHARSLKAVVASGIPEERVFVLQGHVEGKTSLTDLIKHVKLYGLPTVPTQPVRSDTLACIMFSSRTTGFPKAFMISHRDLYHSSMQVEVISQTSGQERSLQTTPEKIPISLAALPFYHRMGATAFILRLFVTPTTLVILPQWNVDLVVKALLQHTITQIAMAPSMMYQLLNHPEFSKVDLDNLESMSTGTSQLHNDLLENLNAGPIIPLFSQKATASPKAYVSTLVAIAQPFSGTFKGRVERKRGMTGILLPGMKARIAQEDGGEADFEEAELFVPGPKVATGYLNDKKSDLRSGTSDGWLSTHDTVVADDQGRFFYVDRVKDTVKVHGVHVSPSEIEKIILEHPEVADCAVAGVRGVRQSDGFVPRAWLVLSTSAKAKGAESVLKAIEKFTRSRLDERQWLRGGLEAIDEV
ncbi:hypothetical protein BJV74DRAFT_888780 [Russula compacta]|nr:hypothetical protein BJV74DRAFT_888780 [Russula compacta]